MMHGNTNLKHRYTYYQNIIKPTHTHPNITEHHPEDDRNSGRNVLMKKMLNKILHKHSIAFCWSFLYYATTPHFVIILYVLHLGFHLTFNLFHTTIKPRFCLCRYLLQFNVLWNQQQFGGRQSYGWKGNACFCDKLIALKCVTYVSLRAEQRIFQL